jgi:hypothetical protein
MQTLTEKRVFGAKSGTTTVYLASELGLVVVTVSADRIGEFGLPLRTPVAAVAVTDDRVVLGTDAGVLVSDRRPGGDSGAGPAGSSAADRRFEPIADDRIGSVVAAGVGPTGPLVADAAGGIFRVADAGLTHVGAVAGVRAIDGSLVAAADGVYRVAEGGVTHVGLTDVRDVAGHGVPLAATAAGLFWLGNGWMTVAEGPFDRVAADGHGHALAVGPDGLCGHAPTADGDERADRTGSDGEAAAIDGSGWASADVPVKSSVVDIAYGGGIAAAITADGTLCVDAGDGWRQQPLGIEGSRALAVGPGRAGE